MWKKQQETTYQLATSKPGSRIRMQANDVFARGMGGKRKTSLRGVSLKKKEKWENLGTSVPDCTFYTVKNMGLLRKLTTKLIFHGRIVQGESNLRITNEYDYMRIYYINLLYIHKLKCMQITPHLLFISCT